MSIFKGNKAQRAAEIAETKAAIVKINADVQKKERIGDTVFSEYLHEGLNRELGYLRDLQSGQEDDR